MKSVAIVENWNNAVTITRTFTSINDAVAHVKDRVFETSGGPVFAVPAEMAEAIEGDDFTEISFRAHRANSTDKYPSLFLVQ